MNQYDSSHADTPRSADQQLRASMLAALSRSEADGLDALQSRVLLQWRMRHAATQIETAGPVASLRAGWSSHRLAVSLLALSLALFLAMAISSGMLWKRADPALDEPENRTMPF